MRPSDRPVTRKGELARRVGQKGRSAKRASRQEERYLASISQEWHFTSLGGSLLEFRRSISEDVIAVYKLKPRNPSLNLTGASFVVEVKSESSRLRRAHLL